MRENPCTCPRNAQRILEVWRPFAQPIVEAAKNKERIRRAPGCVAFLCCCKYAAQHAASSVPPQLTLLWQTMAAIPAEVLQLIVIKAELAYTKSMADAPV